MNPRDGIIALRNLREGRKDWYKVQARAGGAVVTIYDEVGYFGTTARDFSEDIAQVKGDLEVHINSPGGEVFDGLAIYNCLVQRSGQVKVVVDSVAGSICSVIAQAASPGQLVMAAASSMLIHEAHGGLAGTADDMRQIAGVLDQQSDIIAGIYAGRSGKPAGGWRTAMKAETWYGAQGAVEAGLADAVLDTRPGSGPDNNQDLPVFARAEPAGQSDTSGWDPAAFREAFEGGVR